MKDVTMKKDIKDYIHLYIGCEVLALDPYSENEQAMGYLTGIHGEYGPEIQFIIDGNAEESPEYPNYENVKPILRKLSSMTEEEYAYCGKFGFGASRKEYWLQQFEQFENRPVEGQGKKSGIKNPETKKVKVREGLNLSHYTFAPEAFLYLLKKGFWLFGHDWFDEGLILDKATVK